MSFWLRINQMYLSIMLVNKVSLACSTSGLAGYIIYAVSIPDDVTHKLLSLAINIKTRL